MPNEMTPLEAAEKLEFIVDAQRIKRLGTKSDDDGLYESVEQAAVDERKIASGEYAPVAYAHWEQADKRRWPICSNCGKAALSKGYCPVKSNYCPSCGALMGKDDSP